MRHHILVLSLLLLAGLASAAQLRVLSLNVKNDAVGRVPGIVALIRETRADVVGLQEADACGPEIARCLGWRYARLDDSAAVVSRHELAPSRAENGVSLALPDGDEVTLVNLHLHHSPYQPFQLKGIPYGDGKDISTEKEAVSEAVAARGEKVRSVIRRHAAAYRRHRGSIVMGDFNEPSHLDWTRRAADAGRHPIKVEWPATKAFEDAGFRDAYRTLHPDEMKMPGYTWQPHLDPANPKDKADRIDFILYKGRRLRPISARIVGESAATSDLVVSPYPTDHRAKLVVFEVRPRAKKRPFYRKATKGK